jgi:hypothetical protein
MAEAEAEPAPCTRWVFVNSHVGEFRLECMWYVVYGMWYLVTIDSH